MEERGVKYVKGAFLSLYFSQKSLIFAPVTHFIGYIRVSTQKQGQSGLGLEAQHTAIDSFVKSAGGELLETFTEIESGKNNNRPELAAAIAAANKASATLIVAKLDRLSRNVHFLSGLMEAKVPFKCCDLPECDNFTIHLFAALAQKEREMISKRTKEALAAKKARGEKLGSPHNTLTDNHRENSKKSRKRKALANPNNRRATELIIALRPTLSYQKIAAKLNDAGYQTATGKSFTRMTVKLLYERSRPIT